MGNPKVLSLLIVISCFFVNYVVPLSNPSHNLFAADIYKEIVTTKTGNFAVCPLSAQIILALTYSGAKDKTAEELATALDLPNEKETVKGIFTGLSPLLRGDESYNLSSANKIYVKDGFHIKDSFQKIAEIVFHADVQSIDFGKKNEAVKEMNDWVAKQTHDKINNLVAEKDIDSSTMSVLINAMFFEGTWVSQFDERNTHKMDFYKNNNEKAEVDFMTKTEFFEYYESSELNAKFLHARYNGRDASMTFVLPNEKEGLAQLEENIKQIFVEPKYEFRKVHVEIPKFTVESSIDFNDILKNLGVHEAFESSANFEGILEEKVHLKISKVLQKTFVAITESGTTAAAATEVLIAVGASPSFKPPPIMEFVADHPFVFYIKIQDVVFFVGRYNSP